MRLYLRRSTLSALWSRYDLSKVIAGVGQLVGRNLLSLAISLGVASVTTSVLTREQYGVYQFTIGIVAALGFFSLPGTNPVIMQETAKGRHGTLSQALKLRLKAVPFYVVALAVLAGYYAVDGQTMVAWSLVAALVFLPLRSAFDCYRRYLLGLGDYGLYARIPIVVSLGAGLATALAAWTTRDPIAVLASAGAAGATTHIAAYRFVRKVRPPQNADYSASALRFGLGLSALNIMPSIAARLDTALVGTLLPMSEVAVLSLAAVPLEKSKILVGALREFFSPKVVSQTGSGLFRRANRVMLLYVSVLLVYVVLVVLALPVLFQLLFPSYEDIVPLAILGMLCLLSGAPATVMELALYSQERLTQTGIHRLVQFGFSLLVVSVFVRAWGVAGAFVARFLSGAFRTAVASVFYFRNRRQSLAKEAAQ